MPSYETQDEVDAAFAALDELLAEREPARHVGCVNCGGTTFDRGSNPGANCCFYDVCRACGCIAENTYGMDDARALSLPYVSSNYKRIHHWHERISQLLLHESTIPEEHMQKIGKCLIDGGHTFINKDVIRTILRSLNMQVYIEKWLQIIQKVTGIEPPKPGNQLLNMLDQAFVELQEPFKYNKVMERKNFLNYNYVFCRLFQKLGCTQFCMFFPLIKSKQKLKSLDAMWEAMVSTIGWEVKPLVQVAPFAVKLDRLDALSQRIAQQYASQAPVETHTATSKMVFRKSDQHLLRELARRKPQAPRRLVRPELELQTLGSSVKRPRPAAGARPRLLPQSKRRR